MSEQFIFENKHTFNRCLVYTAIEILRGKEFQLL